MRTAIALLALGFVACNGDTQDTDTGDDTDTGGETAEEITARKFAELITVTTDPVAGDLDCFVAGGDWQTQVVDPALQISETRDVVVLDFQNETEVGGATVNVFNNDDVTTTPDVIVVTSALDGSIGIASITAPSCTPVGVKASGTGTKDTYKVHQVFEPEDGGEDVINSVSNGTYTIIPSLLGVSVDEDKSVVAGAVYDCEGEPIEGAQVVFRDADGNIPASLVVRYFDGLPSNAQKATNSDGLWVAMNLPEGDWTAEAYVSDGAGGHSLAGTTEMTSFGNSINISNIYWGFDGGIWYPETCLATPGR